MTFRSHALLGVGVLAAALVSATLTFGHGSAEPAPQSSARQVAQPVTNQSAAAARKPANVVLVVLDDFSTDLTQTLRSARKMRAMGAEFTNAYVVDSLCCVSRASTFTGQFPHQTGVRTNTADPTTPSDPQGGFEAFRHFGNEQRSYALSVQRAGVTTGYIGKYLNQYENRDGILPPPQPGWSDQKVVFGSAYDGWGFDATYLQGGVLKSRSWPVPSSYDSAAAKDKAYAGTVISGMAMDFVRRHANKRFVLQVAPYAPHSRVNPAGAWPGEPVFPAAFRDRPGGSKPAGNCGAVGCLSLTTKDLRGYGDDQRNNQPRYRDGSPAPHWNPPPGGLGVRTATTFLRDRARMAQSADRMVLKLLRTVDLSNTYVILTSDNGFHLGQNGMGAGKGSAYRTDTQVPLFVVGPGVQPGKRTSMVSNIDLAATVEDLSGARTPAYRSGVSLAPTLFDASVNRGDYTYVEHTWSRVALGGRDPDRPTWESSYELRPAGRSEMDQIPSYLAVRSRTELLLRVDLSSVGAGSGKRRFTYEYYDLKRDGGFEKVNRFASAKYADRVAVLMKQLRAFDSCARITRSQTVSVACRDIRYAR